MSRALWLALLVVTTVLAAEVTFQPERVVLVDGRNKNYLVRGNIPIVNG